MSPFDVHPCSLRIYVSYMCYNCECGALRDVLLGCFSSFAVYISSSGLKRHATSYDVVLWLVGVTGKVRPLINICILCIVPCNVFGLKHSKLTASYTYCSYTALRLIHIQHRQWCLHLWCMYGLDRHLIFRFSDYLPFECVYKCDLYISIRMTESSVYDSKCINFSYCFVHVVEGQQVTYWIYRVTWHDTYFVTLNSLQLKNTFLSQNTSLLYLNGTTHLIFIRIGFGTNALVPASPKCSHYKCLISMCPSVTNVSVWYCLMQYKLTAMR